MPRKRGDDFEATFAATRRRLQSLGTVIVPAPTTIPPHTHHAIEIVSEPEPVTALLDGVNVQEVEEELGYEKLARSGEQAWLGPAALDMNHFDVIGVKDLTFEAGVGEGVIDLPRVIHLAGDNDDSEARIDGAEWIDFNDEPTKSVINQPSAVRFNPAVLPITDQAGIEGEVSWSAKERDLVATVNARTYLPLGVETTEYFHPVALGWVMFRVRIGNLI